MSLVSRPNPDYRPWWKRWTAPYLCLVLSPLVTIPISLVIVDSLPSCQIDEPAYRARDVALAIAPCVGDLLPFLWLRSRDATVRRAALIAGLIGAARLALPAYFFIAASIPNDPHLILPPEPPGPCDGYHISILFFVGMVFIMPVLWAISAILAGLAVLITRPRSRTGGPPQGTQA